MYAARRFDDARKKQRPDPLQTIEKLIKERYTKAKAVFWAGSVSRGFGTDLSDLDLIIVYESIPNAYREAFIYDEWPIDAFIYDVNSLCYFLKLFVESGTSDLMYMILQSKEVTEPTSFSQAIKDFARELLKAGPAVWDKNQIDKERFFIPYALNDIKSPASRAAQIASAVRLYGLLAQFFFRSQNKWFANGKAIVRCLQNENSDLADEFVEAFETVFKTGDATFLQAVVHKIVDPFGGLLWDGFRCDVLKDCKG